MPKQGSKSGKSSKTARVLNLLTDPDSIEDPAEETEASPSAAKLPDDRKTQAKIRGALEQELAAEAPTPPAKPRPASPKSASALRAAAPVAEDPEAPAEHPAAPARRPIPPKPATIRPVSFPTIEADEEPEAAASASAVFMALSRLPTSVSRAVTRSWMRRTMLAMSVSPWQAAQLDSSVSFSSGLTSRWLWYTVPSTD